MPQTRSVLSAANASVQIAGREIGQLQSLNAAINYNLQEIRNLYQDNIQSFPRGITTVSLTARRALIDTDCMFGTFDTISKLAEAMDNLAASIPDTTLPYGIGSVIRQNPGGQNVFTEWAATGLQAARFFGGVNDEPTITGAIAGIKSLQEILTGIKNGVSSIGDFFARVPFDVIVKMESNTPKGNSNNVNAFFANPTTLWKFQNCTIGSRTFSLDINNIIVIEECTIACRKFIELPGDLSYQEVFN